MVKRASSASLLVGTRIWMPSESGIEIMAFKKRRPISIPERQQTTLALI